MVDSIIFIISAYVLEVSTFRTQAQGVGVIYYQ